MVVSPPPGGSTPRRPPSPLRRSGIGSGGAPANSNGVASPAGRGLMDSFQARGVLAASLLAIPIAVQSESPPQVQAAPEAAPYDSRRVSSPLVSRFGSFNLGAAPAPVGDAGLLTSLEVRVCRSYVHLAAQSELML